MRLRSVASLVLVALIAGAIAAHADSGSTPRPARVPARVYAAPAARPFAAVAPLAVACAAPAPVPFDRRPRTPQAPTASTTAPPSPQLLDAFAILRRARTDQDALSPEALDALRARGLSPVSLDSSRLLRSTPSGGKAWVVPVPDVTGGLGVTCGPAGKSDAREGVVVVAVGDAAGGGGGALDDLVRGRSPVTVASCAGADHSMLSISGLVPNGVAAVFLTAPDGTAVRADVKDNGYEFLLPNQRAFEQRYVVWTGGDGTPHVQPIVTGATVRASACKVVASKLWQSVARVSPEALLPCMTAQVLSKTAAPLVLRSSRALRLRRRGERLYVVRCAGLGSFAPGAVVTGEPGAVPPVAVLPARPAPVPSVVPAQPVPATPAPAPTPPRKHR